MDKIKLKGTMKYLSNGKIKAINSFLSRENEFEFLLHWNEYYELQNSALNAIISKPLKEYLNGVVFKISEKCQT